MTTNSYLGLREATADLVRTDEGIEIHCPNCKGPSIVENDVKYRSNVPVVTVDEDGDYSIAWEVGKDTDWECVSDYQYSCTECGASYALPDELHEARETWVG